MRFLSWFVADVAGLAVAAWFFDGIWFEGSDWQEKLVPLLIGAAILSVIHMYVAPVVKLLSIPFIVLTLGLFLLVVNACMLLLAGWIADGFDVGFGVDGFWTAVGGAIVLSIVGAFTSAFVLERD
ncbi:phage holin family protein [Nocardioides alcanivorans]|uniref:phage holin family protein n=1 Tax=Nocardioides alcanivorans TaxID=2897352 RepID=UPI001F2521CE|nr:phage holin family protein [Nocardioides alcanivorans]